jgi:hypothetical protein
MVKNFMAHLVPVQGTNSEGSGTAIFSETYLPGGRVSVFYRATVAGTSSAPTNAALVGKATPNDRGFTPQMALPKLKLTSSRDKEPGGSLTGLYEVKTAAPDALFVTRLLSTGKGEAGLIVMTSRFPNGELYGALVPVQ